MTGELVLQVKVCSSASLRVVFQLAHVNDISVAVSKLERYPALLVSAKNIFSTEEALNREQESTINCLVDNKLSLLICETILVLGI